MKQLVWIQKQPAHQPLTRLKCSISQFICLDQIRFTIWPAVKDCRDSIYRKAIERWGALGTNLQKSFAIVFSPSGLLHCYGHRTVPLKSDMQICGDGKTFFFKLENGERDFLVMFLQRQNSYSHYFGSSGDRLSERDFRYS